MRDNWQVITRKGDTVVYHDGNQTVTVKAVDIHSRQFTSEGVTKTRKGKQVTTFFDRRLSREECERTLRVMGVQE